MSSKPELVSVTAVDPLTLTCEWQNCQDVYDDMDAFCEHLEQHLRQFVPPDVPEDTSMTCEWQECGHEMSSILELVRHVYFHAFHVKIKSHGYTLILKNKWRACSLDPASRNTIPDLPERFRCMWTGCSNGIFDNPDMYYKHVRHHAEVSYPEGNHVPGGCKCQWLSCVLTTKSKHKVKAHLRSHTQEKTVACPTCGSLFSTSTRFMDHIKRQQNCDDTSQYYQCSYCNKRFPSERILKDHMRHHVNHYKCPFCEMTCPSPSNLRMHIDYKHSSGKPHKCNQCDFRAKTTNDVRRHTERVHAKSKLKCEVPDCQFECQNLSEYKHHYRNAHEGHSRPYLCHVCGDHFKRGTRLTTHLKKKHKFKWLPGHSRFRFKQHDDGFYRLQTVRYESVEVPPPDAQDSYTSAKADGNKPTTKSSPKRAKTCLKPVKQTDKSDTAEVKLPLKKRSTKRKKPALSYNLEMLGNVALNFSKDDAISAEPIAKSQKSNNDPVENVQEKPPPRKPAKRRPRKIKPRLRREQKPPQQPIHHMPTASELMSMWDGTCSSGVSPKKTATSPAKSCNIWKNFGQNSSAPFDAFDHVNMSPEKNPTGVVRTFVPQESRSSHSPEKGPQGGDLTTGKLEHVIMNFPLHSPVIEIVPDSVRNATENTTTDSPVGLDVKGSPMAQSATGIEEMVPMVATLVDSSGQTIHITTDVPVTFAASVHVAERVESSSS